MSLLLTLCPCTGLQPGTWETSHKSSWESHSECSIVFGKPCVTGDKCTPSANAGHGDPKGITSHRPTVTLSSGRPNRPWESHRKPQRYVRVPHARLEAQPGHFCDSAYRGGHSTGCLLRQSLPTVLHGTTQAMTNCVMM